ncbi:hypothetical protein L9F63_014039, partial [Diploptera punctata]
LMKTASRYFKLISFFSCKYLIVLLGNFNCGTDINISTSAKMLYSQIIMNYQTEIKQEHCLPQTEFGPQVYHHIDALCFILQDMNVEIKPEIDDPVGSVGNKCELLETDDPLASLQTEHVKPAKQ